MANKVFQMNDQAVFMIRELGGHMPGGFFIYKAEEPKSRESFSMQTSLSLISTAATISRISKS